MSDVSSDIKYSLVSLMPLIIVYISDWLSIQMQNKPLIRKNAANHQKQIREACFSYLFLKSSITFYHDYSFDKVTNSLGPRMCAKKI